MASINYYNSSIEEKIFDYVISRMIEEDKTFRDPVHFDILVNHLETRVIDTVTFQRLRKIKQLGTVHLVYHGAEHSRFQHSLGVLYMTSLLIDKIKKNRFSEITVFSSLEEANHGKAIQDKGFVLITRLAALLHDLTVVPFSHTLGKEGNLFPEQWEDEYAVASLIGCKSEIYEKIVNYVELLIQEGFKNIGQTKCEEYAKRFTNALLTYVLRVLKFPDRKASRLCKEMYGLDLWTDIMDEKFVAVASQIVLNTICADLLDYIKRDFYFCGIRKTYDDRFLNYACVTSHSQGPVFAYRLIGKNGEVKNSVLSSILDTLELRYDLAEFVHAHRAKNCFSAMVIEAFNFYWQPLSEPQRQAARDRIFKLGDDELLSYLHDNGGEVTKRLIERYNSRTIYKEVALFRGWRLRSQDTMDAIAKLRTPEERYGLEKRIAKWIHDLRLKEGDCLIYVMPDPKTMYKVLETYAIYGIDRKSGQVRIEQLEKIASRIQEYDISSEETTTAETVKNKTDSLRANYANIWRTSLFIAEDGIGLKDEIIGVIEQIFRLCNITPEFTERGQIQAELLAKIEKVASDAIAFRTIGLLPETLPERK